MNILEISFFNERLANTFCYSDSDETEPLAITDKIVSDDTSGMDPVLNGLNGLRNSCQTEGKLVFETKISYCL